MRSLSSKISSSRQDECPNGCDMKAGQIAQEWLEAGFYGPWSPQEGPRYYSRLIGVEVPGVYDGVLYWQCPDCGAAWHRWKAAGDLHDAAQSYIDKANESSTTIKLSRGIEI